MIPLHVRDEPGTLLIDRATLPDALGVHTKTVVAMIGPAGLSERGFRIGRVKFWIADDVCEWARGALRATPADELRIMSCARTLGEILAEKEAA